MQAREYLLETIQRLPSMTVEQACESLEPLAFIAGINFLRNPKVMSLHADNGVRMLTQLDSSINWTLADESFSPLSVLRGTLDTIVKGVVGAVSTVSAYTLINDKDRMQGVIAELSQMRHPMTLMQKTFPLPGGKNYPLIVKTLSFEEMDALVGQHVHVLQVLSSFINTSKFHATSLPKLDEASWLAPLASLGGQHTHDFMSTTTLFGNISLSTTHNTKNNTWKSSKTTKRVTAYPKEFTIPHPITLVTHIKKARQYLDTIWKIDAEMSKSISEVYTILDTRNSKSIAGKLMRSTLSLYYTNILSATLECAMSYTKLVEHAVAKYDIRPSTDTPTEPLPMKGQQHV